MIVETADKLIALGGSISGILAAVLYAIHRNKQGTASKLQKVEMVKLDEALQKRLLSSDSHCIAYAAVEGVVTEVNKTFQTTNSDKKGVILHSSLVEHKSKRTQGFWADMKKILRDTLATAPFTLNDPDSPGDSILITEATESEGLLDDLEVTYSQFIPRQTSAVQAGIDRIFGEVCRGIQETEEMLVVGTSLMGIGEIFLEDGRLKLRPPQMDGSRYFLTKLSKNQLIKQFQARATTLKVVSTVFGFLAAGLIGFVVYKVARRYWEQRKHNQDIELIRRTALRRRAELREENETPDQTCVVCMTNPREVVTLDCGHISMCSDCTQMLPLPHKCPVCRENIERFLPVYRP